MVKHRKPFLVHTTCGTSDPAVGFIPEGSGIYVSETLKAHYRGVWASMWGSFTVKVAKKDCRRVRGVSIT